MTAREQERLRMLYLMHLPWGWIKQRPHFLAEHLHGRYQVDVYCSKFYTKKWLVKTPIPETMHVHEFHRLPLARYPLFERINRYLAKQQIRTMAANYDLFWVTFPSSYDAVSGNIPDDALLIYDCMDDALEFPVNRSSAAKAGRLAACEQALLERADLVFASSEHLRKKLHQRYGMARTIHVVNNAIMLEEHAPQWSGTLPPLPEGRPRGQAYKKLMYIGTISEWLDVGLLLDSLSRHPDIVYYLIGPTDVELPVHERLIHVPPVEHRYIYSCMEQADALILPFTVTELIRSVDPVKMYEYVSSGKPVIAAAYDEMSRFRDYVHLYGDPEEYHRCIASLVDAVLAAKKSRDACLSFVRRHTWAERVQEMSRLIDAAVQRKQAVGIEYRSAETPVIVPTAPEQQANGVPISDVQKAILPNFFIIGAAKAGTTSIYAYLRQHPDVYMPTVKEPNYFCSDIDPGAFGDEYRSRLAANCREYLARTYRDDIHAVHISRWEEYVRLFAPAGNAKAVGEASVSYLYSHAAAALIKQRVPEAKIIAILRNPVDRAYSHYLMDLRMGYTALPFRKAVERDRALAKKGWGVSHLYLELGCYYEQIKKYLDAFGADNIRIVLYEQLQDPAAVMKMLFQFLAVDDAFMPDMSVRHNVERIPKSPRLNYWLKNTGLMQVKRILAKRVYERTKDSLYSANVHPQMSAEDRRYLVTFYQSDVEKLSSLLQKDLSHWMR